MRTPPASVGGDYQGRIGDSKGERNRRVSFPFGCCVDRRRPVGTTGFRLDPRLRPPKSTRLAAVAGPFLGSGYASASCGTRSPSRIAKRCKAAFQFCTGIVHFLAICSNARNSSFIAASALGNEPRVLITLRSDMFSDSIAFVV